MLDLALLRENPSEVEKMLKNRRKKLQLGVFLQLDETRRKLQKEVEELRAQRNNLAHAIGAAKKEDREKLINQAALEKTELAKKEDQLKDVIRQAEDFFQNIPNLVHPDVPVGPDESGNKPVRVVGKKTELGFTPQDHLALGTAADIIDTETAALVSGSRFYYLKNEAVLLQMAILQLVFNTVTNGKTIARLAKKVGSPSSKPFTPILPPVLMRPAVMRKMDRLDPADDRYVFEDKNDPSDTMVLVGSAEHTLGPYYMDQILAEEDLPIRFIGYSTAFRREAGSYGKDVTGILRTHQFDKLEMESFTTPEAGLAEQDLLVAIQEELMQQLELPYQVVAVCTGDMGKPDYRQIDIETWMPSQNKYRETHSSDYTTDYQSRRLNTRYRTAEGKTQLVHMNDATAFAIGRILIAILENNQQKDGSIKVPKVLAKLSGIKVIAPR